MSLADKPLTTTARRYAFPLAVFAALVLTAMMSLPQMRDILRSGAFYDTDDAMRMVQVRDWMAGQSWFDLNVARMDPPRGTFMHWSRIVDVPLGALVRLFQRFANPELAERLARLAFPFAMLAALYAAAGWTSGIAGGMRARVPGVFLALLSGALFAQFVPGRVDHHAPQIVLLVLMTGATLAAFNPARAGLAALSGALAALSLGISLENLPFIAIIAAAHGLIWVSEGERQSASLLAFAAGLAAGLIAVFMTTIGPSRWGLAACDAYSLTHLAAGLAGACAFAVAALAPLRSSLLRLVALALCAAVALITMALVAPTCLGDPFVGLDPLVREIWLRNVAEVQPVTAWIGPKTNALLAIGAPIVLAFLACVMMAIHLNGVDRARMILLAALIAIGLAMTFWGVRVFSSVGPLAAIAGAAFAAHITQKTSANRAAIMIAACIPFAPFSWAIALPQDPESNLTQSFECLAPSAFRAMDAQAPGLILAPIDTGAHLLAHTHHSVLGAPYHRNNHGNRLVLDALLAPAAKAQNIVRASGAVYVLICPGQRQSAIVAERAPDGLAADLIAGRIPAWLAPVPLDSTPQKLFRVVN